MNGYDEVEIQDQEVLLVKAFSVIVHLKEHIDTGETADLDVANGMLSSEEMIRWIDDNEVMLPLRRDGKALHYK